MVSDDDSGPNETSMNWILSAFELTSTSSKRDHVPAPPSLHRPKTSTGRNQRWVDQSPHTASC